LEEQFHREEREIISAITGTIECLRRKEKIVEDLRKELRAAEATTKRLHEQHKAEKEAMLLSHAREMKKLEEENMVLENEIQYQT
jgi:hypothetical protein